MSVCNKFHTSYNAATRRHLDKLVRERFRNSCIFQTGEGRTNPPPPEIFKLYQEKK